MQKAEKNLLSIQALRGIAAILVVFCHSMQYISVYFPVRMERYLGYCFGGFGVDIFFVISGFIMVYISAENFGKSKAVGSFIINRIFRIYPMYWIVTLTLIIFIIPSGLYAQAMLEKQQVIVPAIKNLSYVIENLLLLPPFYLTKGIIPPIVAVAWTLFLEMFFYFIFGFLLLFNKKIYLPTLCFIFVTFVLLHFAFLDFKINNSLSPYFSFYGNDIIIEFMFGCFIAEQYLAGKLLTNSVAFLVVSMSILVILLSYHTTLVPLQSSLKSLQHGIPAAFIVLGLVSLEVNGMLKIPALLRILGDSSYSIYLTHLSIFLVLLINLLKQIAQYIPVSGDIAVAVSWTMCVLLGCLAYHYIEKPITKFLKQIRNKNVPLKIYSESQA